MRYLKSILTMLCLSVALITGIAEAYANGNSERYVKTIKLRKADNPYNRPLKPENMQLTIEYNNRDIRLLISEDTEFAQLSISRGPLAEYTEVVYDSSQIISIPECFVGIYTVTICVDGEYFYETELLFR